MRDGFAVIYRTSRWAAALFLAAAIIACNGESIGPGAGGLEYDAPVHYAAEDGVSDQYIVVFREGAGVPPGLARRLVDQHGGELLFEYSAALTGFAAKLPEQALQGIRRNPHVELIEQDAEVFATQTVQSNATRGLDRVDQRPLPLDYAYTYFYTGEGVTAYIVDTGIRFDHEEFEGRAVPGFDAFADGQNGNDCNGHGTHVAGTVGGRLYGVAKEVGLVSVRVLDCHGSGSSSTILAGIDWIIRNNTGPAVANFSLGGGVSETVNSAVRKLIAAGVQASVSAGNDGGDACLKSPASTREAVTVGGVGSRDVRRSSSNWGDCVDVFAPGTAITSASNLDTSSSQARSGTSMAAPHAAGIMALWLHENPALTPTQLAHMIVSNATQNVVEDARSTNAHMLYSLLDDAPPVTTPPSASFSASCSGLTCSFDASTSTGGSAIIERYDWTFGDGATGTGVTSSRTYATGGSYTITLTVTNTQAATSQAMQAVSVSTANQAPVAWFTTSCQGLACTFTDASTDADGSIVSWSWDFGDGRTSTTRDPSHTFDAAGTYTVGLTVTDDAGATGSTSQDVTVSATAPTAEFTVACTGAECQFTDASISASSVRQWSWSFGDGGTSSVQNPLYVYHTSGTYSVRLEVTDDLGQASSTTRTVSVTVPPSGITLEADPYRVKGRHRVELVWTGASGSQVTIHRDGAHVGTVTNSGLHTDAIERTGRADYRYQVCEIGTGVCSPELLVEFR